MSAAEVKSLRETLVAAQFDPGRPAFQYPYQRGFNEGLGLALRKLDEITKEKP